MTNKIVKKNLIKVPKNILVFLCDNNIITLVGPFGIKSLKLKLKIKLFDKYILITKCLTKNMDNYSEKKLNFLFNFYFLNLKQIIDELSNKLKKKLNIVGIGFRALILNISNSLILHLKIGYSHQIYIKIPKNILVICPKPTQIFLLGNDKKKINQLAVLIKSYKIPEPYKGKGIFYDNESINLKEGKKI